MTSALSNCTATPCTRGRREELIELFETELLHTQEAVGSRVLAQFRDLDHPDTFTWMRGFRDMDHRRRALMAFYGGPVWAQHRDAANATMIDSDNVLLLTPEGPLHRLLPGRDHPVRIVVSHGDTTSVVPGVAIAADSQWSVASVLTTLHAENTFPALPVREDAGVRVTVLQALGATASESALPPADVSSHVEVLRLEPTERSSLLADRELQARPVRTTRREVP